MSQENVEIARRACKAAWRRPRPDFDTLNALAHPDHVMFTAQSLVEGGGGYRGAQGFREWLASWTETFGEEWEVSFKQGRAIDDERVLVTGWTKAQGLRGGVQVEEGFWVIITVRGGKVTRAVVYTDRDQALEAAGLSE